MKKNKFHAALSHSGFVSCFSVPFFLSNWPSRRSGKFVDFRGNCSYRESAVKRWSSVASQAESPAADPGESSQLLQRQWKGAKPLLAAQAAASVNRSCVQCRNHSGRITSPSYEGQRGFKFQMRSCDENNRYELFYVQDVIPDGNSLGLLMLSLCLFLKKEKVDDRWQT